MKEVIYLRGGEYDGEQMHVEEDQYEILLPVPGNNVTYIRTEKTEYGFPVFKPKGDLTNQDTN